MPTDTFDSSDSVRSARPLKHAQSVTFREPFELELGKQLPEVTVVFETYGRLNRQGDNAVLICHALSGDSHVARHEADDDPGVRQDIREPLRIEVGAKEHDQQAGGERIERPRVSDFRDDRSQRSPHPGHHVVRRAAGRLVDQQDAVERRSSSTVLSHSVTPSTVPPVVKPAACRCPPPPLRPATALTSKPSERRLTLTRPSPCGRANAAT